MTLLAESDRGFVVHLRNLRTWSPAAYVSPTWGRQDSRLVPLQAVAVRRREKVTASDRARLPLITIRFDGSVEVRAHSRAEDIRGQLFLARAGDLVLSKIDARNGAIAIVPENLPEVAVTSEFPVYVPRSDLVDPGYLELVLRSRTVRDAFGAMKSGASGRKRISTDQFESIQLPLPPIGIQEAWVGDWRESEAAAGRLAHLAAECKAAVSALVLQALHVDIPSVTMARAFALPLSRVDRWGVSHNQLTQLGLRLATVPYPIVPLGQLVEFSQYGTSVKPQSNPEGVSLVRMNNLSDGHLTLADLKYVPLKEPDVERLCLQQGDVLVNRTNSKELVGKSAVFREPGTYVFASYLIRLRLNASLVIPEFVVAVLNSPVGRHQIRTVSRQIIGQANINLDELRALRIPLPPLGVQRRLCQEISMAETESARLSSQAEQLRTDAERVLADALLGGFVG
jgi:hypothetical protein